MPQEKHHIQSDCTMQTKIIISAQPKGLPRGRRDWGEGEDEEEGGCNVCVCRGCPRSRNERARERGVCDGVR